MTKYGINTSCDVTVWPDVSRIVLNNTNSRFSDTVLFWPTISYTRCCRMYQAFKSKAASRFRKQWCDFWCSILTISQNIEGLLWILLKITQIGLTPLSFFSWALCKENLVSLNLDWNSPCCFDSQEWAAHRNVRNDKVWPLLSLHGGGHFVYLPICL